eukprot:SAG25_NODE_69_length_17425_cov_289.898476_3_plen_68_part_00
MYSRGGVDKALARLEHYSCAKTAVLQLVLQSTGILLGRYALCSQLESFEGLLAVLLVSQTVLEVGKR